MLLFFNATQSVQFLVFLTDFAWVWIFHRKFLEPLKWRRVVRVRPLLYTAEADTSARKRKSRRVKVFPKWVNYLRRILKYMNRERILNYDNKRQVLHFVYVYDKLATLKKNECARQLKSRASHTWVPQLWVKDCEPAHSTTQKESCVVCLLGLFVYLFIYLLVCFAVMKDQHHWLEYYITDVKICWGRYLNEK